jgi:hypothetical protein
MMYNTGRVVLDFAEKRQFRLHLLGVKRRVVLMMGIMMPETC